MDDTDLSWLDNWNGDTGDESTNFGASSSDGTMWDTSSVDGWNGDFGDASTNFGASTSDSSGWLSQLFNSAPQLLSQFGGGLINMLKQNTGNNTQRTVGGDLGGALTGFLGAGAQKQTYQDAWNQMLKADPFNAQTPKYQDMLQNILTNGIGDTPYGKNIASSVARQDAAKGYNMSGNMLHDIAGGLNTGTMNMAQALTPLAMGRAPDTRGLAPLATGMANAQGQQYSSAGYGLGSILNGLTA